MKLENVALCATNEIPGCVQASAVGQHVDLYFDNNETQANINSVAKFAYDYGGFVFYGRKNNVTIAFHNGKAKNPHKRVQISLKLEQDVDRDILSYLDRVENMQGLIKQLLRESMAARTLEAINKGLEAVHDSDRAGNK